MSMPNVPRSTSFTPDVDPFDDEKVIDTSLKNGRYIFVALDVEKVPFKRKDGGSFLMRRWSFRPVGGSEPRPTNLPLEWRWNYNSNDAISSTNNTGRLIAALMGLDTIQDVPTLNRRDYIGKYVVVDIIVTERGYNQPMSNDAFYPLTEELWDEMKWPTNKDAILGIDEPTAPFTESEF